MRHRLCTLDSSRKNEAASAQQEELTGAQGSLAQPSTMKRGVESECATALKNWDQPKAQTRTCEACELANIMKWASFFFPEGRSHCAAQLLSLLREAQVASQNELGVKDAIA